MSKVAILCDTHAGVKNGSDIYLDYAERFYKEVFFPSCDEHNIKRILHLGDFFDHRKYVNFKVTARIKKMFLDEMEKRGMTMDIICGNHDVYWKNTNSLNSLQQLLGHVPFITIHMDPTVIDVDGLSVGMLPWITKDNHDECMDFIAGAPTSILMGHLELAGFKYIGGTSILSHGMDHSIFNRFEMVLSGHYHSTSQKDNVRYLGAPLELTWNDVDDAKYFHVLNTETRELGRIRNPYRLFRRIYYDDSTGRPSLPKRLKDDNDVYIKVIVLNKRDPFLFDRFIDRIQSLNPLDVKIVEAFDGGEDSEMSSEEIAAMDTTDLLDGYVESIDTELDRDRLKKSLIDLYTEAQTLE